MNKKILSVVATMIAATVFFINSVYSMGSTKSYQEKINPIECPDFAYPQTVISNAEKSLIEAIESSDSIKLIKCLIQIAVAEKSISTSNLSSVLHTIDSISQNHQSPTIKSLLYLSEAMIYKSLYGMDRWKYDERNLPLDSFPSDFEAWSKDLYALKILELSKQALANDKELMATPSTKYSELFAENDSQWQSFYPTMYDVVAYNLLNLMEDFIDLETIPFIQESIKSSLAVEIKEFRSEILDKIENIHQHSGCVGASIIAQIAQINPMMTEKNIVEQLVKLLEEYSESEYSAELIFQLNNYVDEEYLSDEEYYKLCKNYIERFPNGYTTESVKKIIERYEAPLLNVISVKGRFLSGENIATVIQVRNVDKFYVKLFSVDVSYMISNRNDWVRSEKKLIKTVTIVVDEHDSVNYLKEIDLGGLDYGCYSMCVVTEKNEIPDSYNDYEHFVVTDMETLVVTDHNKSRRLYLIDSREGRPIEGANVEFLPNDEYRLSLDKSKFQTITDKNGSIGLNFKLRGQYKITRGNDILHGDTDMFYAEHYSENEMQKIFTDLAIYHPGDTVKFSVLSYNKNGKNYLLEKNKRITIKLIDANRKEINQLLLVTDDDGRVEGYFKLPEDGLRGRFILQTDYASCGIRVEDYKAPSFYVEVDKTNSDITVGDKFVVKGVVKTYSDMPISNAKIKFDIHYSGWWFTSSNATYAGETTTDADGRFVIELHTELLKGTCFARGSYKMVVHATSESGETQDSEPIRFFTGENYTINIEDSTGLLCADSSDVSMKVNVMSMLREPKIKEVEYELVGLDNSERKYTGVFTSPLLKIPTKGLCSGKYLLSFRLKSDSTVMQNMEVVVYRNKENRPPFVTPLWVTDKNIIAQRGEEFCDVTMRSSYKDSQVLCVVSNTSKILYSSWETISGYKKTLKIPVPGDDDKVTVHMYALRNGEFYQEEITLLPASINDKLVIETLSFRNKIIPNTAETWKFKFKYADKELAYIPALASMTDKSLNAIEKYSWDFSPSIMLQDVVETKKINWYFNHGYIQNRFFNSYDSALKLPILDFYDRLYLYGRKDMVYMEAESCNFTTISSAVNFESASEEESFSVVAYGTAIRKSLAINDTAEQEQRIEYRETEYPSVFFYPNLKSNENGELEISFDVPNFNTTWQFQLLGYTDKLQTSLIREDVVSNKPIMAQSNLPRFVRTGDEVKLKALLFNNSQSSANIEGRIELFDPTTEEVLKEKIIASEEVKPNGQRTVFIDYLVPDTLPFIGYRVYAKSGNYIDGEQSLIAVNPSSSPVVESLMFYMKAGNNERVIQMPNSNDDARHTFIFCDNPIWYCFTALPDIVIPGSDNIFSLLSAFYGNVVSEGLIREYPQIREALTMLFDPEHTDNTILISPLQKQSDLKIVELENTTWLQDAKYETLRMGRLKSLLDTVHSKEVITDLIKLIGKLQVANGGIKWTPASVESIYATGQTLLHLAMLRDMGYLILSEEVDKIIINGIKYIDNELLAIKDNHISTGQILNYLYIRSSFSDIIDNPSFSKLKNAGLNSIIEEWREFDIYNKATAAILLYREDIKNEAEDILESLRQFALTTEEQGCYFDNIGSSWNGFDRLITTTQVLEAFSELQPRDKIIDELRQWLLIQRQAQGWSSPSHIVEVIHAIFTTGSDWIKSHKSAQMWVGQQQCIPTDYELLTGSFRMDLTSCRGNEIKIVTDGLHSSWGGVVTQYIAPMKDVHATTVESLSIEKNIYVVDETTGATKLYEAEKLKVGQRIRVQLKIDSERDIDYVAITDERAAFMEPLEQTSNYKYRDGIGYYQEIRNTNNNMFIDFLPKGSHFITYDCHVSQEGIYSVGIATIQSQYAPLITAHSAGQIIVIDK